MQKNKRQTVPHTVHCKKKGRCVQCEFLKRIEADLHPPNLTKREKFVWEGREEELVAQAQSRLPAP